VVEVRVGEQDGLDVELQLRDGALEAGRLLPGVDDERGGGTVAAEDEAVLGQRADREGADVHHCCCWRRMRRW
jgi:hypothetical protein